MTSEQKRPRKSSSASLSLSAVFPDNRAARAALLDHLPPDQRNLPALSLSACASVPYPVVPATGASRRAERFDDRYGFGTAVTRTPYPDASSSSSSSSTFLSQSQPPHPAQEEGEGNGSGGGGGGGRGSYVLYVAAHLVGQLTGSVDGFLMLHCPPHRHRTRILVAPAPPPQLRSAPLYIRDWRHLPRAAAPLSPVLEVQLRDIVPLLLAPAVPVPSLAPAAPSQRAAGKPPAAHERQRHRATHAKERARPLAPGAAFKAGKLHSLSGRVSARSPVLSTRRSRQSFLLELVSECRQAAVTVVFPQHTTSWWPFLHPGHIVTLTELSLCKLPHVSDRFVLAVTPKTRALKYVEGESVCAHEMIQSEPQQHQQQQQRQKHGQGQKQKQSQAPSNDDAASRAEGPAPVAVPVAAATLLTKHRTPPSLPYSFPPPKQTPPSKPVRVCSGSIVDYVGEVSRFLPPDALELDARVILHLSDFTLCTAGRMPSRSYRVGTRIAVTNVIALKRPLCAPALLPTPRTSIDVLFFAPLPTPEKNVALPTRNGDSAPATLSAPDAAPAKKASDHPPSGWRELRRVAQPPILAWGGELAAALRTKCGDWFGDSVSSALLGTPHTAGLVQFTMFVLGGPPELIRPGSMPRRNAHKEFMYPSKWVERDFAQPLVPTMRAVETAAVTASPGVVSSKTLAALMSRSSNVSIALVGLLSCSMVDGAPRITLSDSTAKVTTLIPGGLQPSLLGAVVAVKVFRVVVSNRALAPPAVTIAFRASDVCVVVDGPCAAMERDATGGLVVHDSSHVATQCPESQEAVLSCMGSLPGGADGKGKAERGRAKDPDDSNPPDSQDVDALTVDYPLVGVFVESLHGDRDDVFHVHGRLLGCRQSRTSGNQEDEPWQLIDDDRKGFWRCDLRLSGEAMLGLTGAFQLERVFAVSCSELHGIEQTAVEYLRIKARNCIRAGHVRLALKCNLEEMLPWVENLGSGMYMRFSAGSGADHPASDEAAILVDDSVVSVEGEQYMYTSKAIEQFRAEARQRVEKHLWKLFGFADLDDLETEKTVHLRGVVQDFEEHVELSAPPTLLSSATPLKTGATAGRASHPAGWEKDGQIVVGRLTIVDVGTGLFDVGVDFFASQTDAAVGLHRGMAVELHDVMRVPQSNGTRFAFVATPKTFIRLLGDDEQDGVAAPWAGWHDAPLLRCPGGADADDAREYRGGRAEKDKLRRQQLRAAYAAVGRRYVSELGRQDGKCEQPAGVLRVESMQVELVALRATRKRARSGRRGGAVRKRKKRAAETRCGGEGNADGGGGEGEDKEEEDDDDDDDDDDEARVKIEMQVVAEVDDGSDTAEVRCHGEQLCYDLLGLSANERRAVQRLAHRIGFAEFQSGGDNGTSGNRFDFGDARVVEDARTVQGIVNARRSGGGVPRAMVVVWRDAGVAQGAAAAGAETVVMRGYRMGFSRTLWTACRPKARRLRLDCVACFGAACVNSVEMLRIVELDDDG